MSTQRGSTNSGKTARRDRRAWARKLESIAEILGIGEWNYLLIGDGSGNLWEHPCAFASVLIENGSDWRDVFFGGFNCGTNTYAELMAYTNPLDWLAELDKVRRTASGACRIHILSDSEYCVETGNGNWRRKSHKPTWAKYDAYRERGFFIEWHWIPGHEGIPANEFCDTLAGSIRKIFKDVTIDGALKSVERSSIQKLYPVGARNG